MGFKGLIQALKSKILFFSIITYPCFVFFLFSDNVPFTSSATFRTIIFFVLTLQATCYFSLLRYSRTRTNKMYFASTAVFLAEVIKLLVTLLIIFIQRGNLKDFASFLIDNLHTNPLDALKLSVPSVLYIIQNNLVYIGMTHLESTTFQVCTWIWVLCALFILVTPVLVK